MSELKDIAIIIPANKPDNRLIELVNKLTAQSFGTIIVVDDGGKGEYSKIFSGIKDSVALAVHNEALGRGRSIKTGINLCMNYFPTIKGIVIVDSNGRDLIEDIVRVARKLKENPNYLYLGVRKVNEATKKTKYFMHSFANIAYRFTIGKKVDDITSTLKGIPLNCKDELLKLSGEKNDYEINILCKLDKLGLKLKQIKVETVYYQEKQKAHILDVLNTFKPLVSSLKSCLFSELLFLVVFFGLLVVLPENFLVVFSVAKIMQVSSNLMFNSQVILKKGVEGKRNIVILFTFTAINFFIVFFTVKLAMGVMSVSIAIILAELLAFLLLFALERDILFQGDRR